MELTSRLVSVGLIPRSSLQLWLQYYCTIVSFPGLVLLLIWHVHVYTASSITCDTEIDPHSGWFGVWG